MQQNYNPNHLLDSVLFFLALKNDAALARALDVAPPVLSKIRHRTLAVGGSFLIRLHEVTGKPVSELQSLMGDRRQKFRLSSAQGRPKPGADHPDLKEDAVELSENT